jgi:hypothetical protein
MFFKNQVLGCGGIITIQCYLYTVANNTWNTYPTGAHQYGNMKSIVYRNKFYFFHATNPVIFDPEIVAWYTWPQVPLYSEFSCTVVYKNTLLRIGGMYETFRTIFQYNGFDNFSWVQLNTSNAPMDMRGSTCGVLPNDNILIIGSSLYSYHFNIFSIYNVASNTWALFGPQSYASVNSHIFSFGQQAFIVLDKAVYEFDYKNINFTLRPFSFFQNRGNAHCSIYVPSGMLNSLPRGCKGTWR